MTEEEEEQEQEQEDENKRIRPRERARGQKCAQFLSALFRSLVGLMMTLFSEKMLISHRCIRGLMPNLIKKSWTDYKPKPINLATS